MIADFDVVLADAMHAVLQSHRRDCIGDQNEPGRVCAISDSQRCAMSVDSIGNDAEVDDFSVGNFVGREQTDQPRIAMVKL